jgi:cupredoxin-like protein
MAQRAMAAAGAVALVLALGSAPSRGDDAPSYTLAIRQHRFEPVEVEIPAGKKIALVVKNLDATPEEFESIELHREKVVSGGSEITVYIGPLKPGRYEFFGDFNPDTARGHIIAK